MNDFGGGMEFGAGSLRGVRWWTVSAMGHLGSLTQTCEWRPGENVGVCKGYPSEEQVPKMSADEGYASYNVRVEAWRMSHDMSDCNHGFYAYFGEQFDHYDSKPRIAGVIEGYGELIIGTKGFRSMKARILALSTESFEGAWRLDPYVEQRLRASYPGVTFFESTFAMLAEFPADLASQYADLAA